MTEMSDTNKEISLVMRITMGESKILKLKGLLRRSQTILDSLILRTPTGLERDAFTHLNIEIQAELEDM